MLVDLYLQAIQPGEALLPALVPGFHVDMPDATENARLGAPVDGELQRTCGSGCRIVVRANQLARERHRLARQWSEIAQWLGAVGSFDVRWRNQQGTAHATE